jgi:hypothetical protein
MCDMRPSFCLAEEVGEGLGRGALLLGPVPWRKKAADW